MLNMAGLKIPGKRLLSKYWDLKEANSTSDFPNLLANVMHKILLDKFKGVNSPWRQYTLKGNLEDFKSHDRVILDEAPDLLEKEELAEGEDSTLGDHKYSIQLSTFDRRFTVSRQAIINDDLTALRRQPQRFGRSAGRTIAKKVVARLEGDGNTYDNKSLFNIADHNNFRAPTLTNDAAGIELVAGMMTRIQQATDETGEKMGLQAKYLLVPPELEDTAMRIVNGTAFIPVTSSGGTTEVGKVKRLTPIVEPYFTSSSKFYVFADPQDAPVIEVGFLNGKEAPDLLVQSAQAIRVAGGQDEWGYDFDDMSFKVRLDLGTALAYYQGVQRSG